MANQLRRLNLSVSNMIHTTGLIYLTGCSYSLTWNLVARTRLTLGQSLMQIINQVATALYANRQTNQGVVNAQQGSLIIGYGSMSHETRAFCQGFDRTQGFGQGKHSELQRRNHFGKHQKNNRTTHYLNNESIRTLVKNLWASLRPPRM